MVYQKVQGNNENDSHLLYMNQALRAKVQGLRGLYTLFILFKKN